MKDSRPWFVIPWLTQYLPMHAPPTVGLSASFAAGALLVLGPWAGLAQQQSKSDYPAVHEIFERHCLDCHAAQEPEAKLVLESFETLMKGGESGPALVPGKSGESLLVKMIEGSTERDGKRRIMPPGKRPKLSSTDIAAVRSWIDAGARPPAQGEIVARELQVPKVPLKTTPRRPIQALAYASGSGLIALGRYTEVELFAAQNRVPVRVMTALRGSVNALAFSADGAFLFAGGGEAGLMGEVRELNVGDGSLARTFSGHKDAIYSIALSPDGKTLASGSYDQKIKLWNVQSGAELKTLSGHNGAVFDLSFRPDGAILASASADRTVKLWDVATGERRDTLSQSSKEVYAVAFSSDGTRLFAGGGDNRIRVWEISEKALETTNPILESRFAHEGAILRLALSADGKALLSSASDQTVKVWDTASLTERLSLPSQPDWVSAIRFAAAGKQIAVGRLDGTWDLYDAMSGKVLEPPKPQLARAEPRGIQRGLPTKVKLIGANLNALQAVKFVDTRIQAELGLGLGGDGSEQWMTVSASVDLPQGAYDFSVRTRNGESGMLKLYIDDLPQVYADSGQHTTSSDLAHLPVSVWGVHRHPGDADEFSFSASRGQSLVFDVAARSLSSKADIVLTLTDADGKVLASSNSFDRGGDPLIFQTFTSAGQYRLRVSELVLGGSPDHFYRLSVGAFPYVTGCYPLSVQAGHETAVELIGYNLPPDHRLSVHPDQPGESELPLDRERYRARRQFKLIASAGTESLEAEPNDAPSEANRIVPPCAVGGHLWSRTGSADADLFRFQSSAGQSWIIETAAAQRGSPADTRIEILHADGKPVERLKLQAVRDSSVTFRGIDSDGTDCRVVNWEEMELNQYLYLQGEVVKLFRAPQGPDSGFLFYGSNGKRRCYFDTSPAAHALDEPCYIVEPHPPGAKLVSSGLPVFPLYYANDDDGERKLGADSKLQFTAPADGEYLVRVTDTRGFSGERFVYRLVVRATEPDFVVHLRGSDLGVNAGSGQPFSIDAERADGFEGEIKVDFAHLPAGFIVSTPLIIEAGHTEARGTIHAALDTPPSSPADWAKVQVTASATVEGHAFVKAVGNFGLVKLADQPKLFVALTPDTSPSAAGGATNAAAHSLSPAMATSSARPLELTIAPGQTIPAMLRVRRHGHDDLITFTVENLPHGVIVDNIGLNGVLIPKGQDERQIFLSAARWVGDTDRLCYAVESQAGRQTSLPVLLHVRRNTGLQAQK